MVWYEGQECPERESPLTRRVRTSDHEHGVQSPEGGRHPALEARGALVGGWQLSSFPVQVTVQCVLVRFPCSISNEPTTTAWNLIPTITTLQLSFFLALISNYSFNYRHGISCSLQCLQKKPTSSRPADDVNEPQLWMPTSSGPSTISSTTNARLELLSMSHFSYRLCAVLQISMLMALKTCFEIEVKVAPRADDLLLHCIFHPSSSLVNISFIGLNVLFEISLALRTINAFMIFSSSYVMSMPTLCTSLMQEMAV